MNHRIFQRVALYTSSLLLSSSLLAQELSTDEEPEEIRRYTVEIVIFAYDESVTAGTEVFLPDEPPPFEISDSWLPLDDAAEFDDPELQEIEVLQHVRREELQDIDQRLALVMLQEEEFELLDILDRLDELGAYVPLMHFGWTQPTYPREETETRPLSFFGRPPEGLAGEVSLYLSRYLHLAVNLQMDESTLADFRESRRLEEGGEPLLADQSFSDDQRNGQFSFGDGINELAFGDTSGSNLKPYPVRYRIEEDRIFKNGELRYFDHPRFGVLAKVSRYEEPEPQEEELAGLDGE